MDGEITIEMGYQKIWRYLHLFANGLAMVRPILFIILGIWMFFFVPDNVEDTIHFTKRQLLGMVAILVGTMELNKAGLTKRIHERKKQPKGD